MGNNSLFIYCTFSCRSDPLTNNFVTLHKFFEFPRGVVNAPNGPLRWEHFLHHFFVCPSIGNWSGPGPHSHIDAGESLLSAELCVQIERERERVLQASLLQLSPGRSVLPLTLSSSCTLKCRRHRTTGSDKKRGEKLDRLNAGPQTNTQTEGKYNDHEH